MKILGKATKAIAMGDIVYDSDLIKEYEGIIAIGTDREEKIYFENILNNLDGTYTLIGVKRNQCK